MTWSRRRLLEGLGVGASSLITGCTPFSGSEHQPPEVPESIAVRLPPIARHEFGGDAQLYMIEDQSTPLVSMAACVQSGFADDPPGKEGLAELVSGCLLRPQSGVIDAFARLGARPYLRLEPTSLGVYCTVERRHAPAALRLLLRVFESVDRSQEAFEAQRRALHELLEARRGAPKTLGGYGIVLASLSVDPPTRALSSGSPGSLATIELADAHRWIDAHLRPSRLSFALAGALNLEEAKSWAAGAAQDWAVPRAEARPSVERGVPASKRSGAVLIPWPDMRDVILSCGVPTAAFGTPDKLALDAATSHVASRFNAELRTHQRTSYGLDLDTWTTRSGDVLQLHTPLAPEALQPAVQGFLHRLHEIRDDLPRLRYSAAAQLDHNRLSRYVSMMRAYETTDGALSQLLRMADIRLPVEAAYARYEQLSSLSGEQVAQAIVDHFRPEDLRWSLVAAPEVIEKTDGLFGDLPAVVRSPERLVGTVTR